MYPFYSLPLIFLSEVYLKVKKKKIILLQPPLKAEVQEILDFPEQT